MKRIIKLLATIFSLAIFFFGITHPSLAAMNDYCVVPPFVAQSVPPLVTFVSARDHKLYYQAYSDAADLDEDGKLDIDYKHSIDYYGYFDPYKCYSYNSTDARFDPLYTTTTKFCNGSDGHWSGNVLNWVGMSRMDVLRKVLYGGYRSVDTTSETVLKRVYVPRDAHSWGKELTGYLCNSGTTYKNTCYTASDCDTGYSCVNKSKALIGIDPSDVPSTCTATAVSSTAGGMLVARYQHSTSKNCGISNSQGLINSYEPGNLFNPVVSTQIDKPSPDGNPVPGTSDQLYYVAGFDDYTLNPARTYADNYNILVVTRFTANSTGTWSFAVDGDDDVEVQVDGQVVAQYLGCHGPANNQDHNGIINLTSGQTYTLVARHFEKGGGEGVKVWFKRPGDAAWSIFNNANLNSSLTAPLIASGNECAIKTNEFVTNGTPSTGTVVSGGNTTQHLFCSTTLTVNGTPIIRRLQKKSNRMWEWSAKERPVCDTSLGTPDDFTVQVKVCDSSIGLESNCKDYSGTKKPTGMIQKYGEGDGIKICAKNFSKVCTSDTDCGSGEGLCMYNAPMYFGMVSGSYRKNTSGGVLRKNISAVLGEEVNAADGTLVNTTNTPGNIISAFNTMRIADFDNSSYSCGWIGDRAMNDGECRDWGNPIAEMMYETLRYLGGKSAATTEFTYTEADDAGLSLPKPVWDKYRTTGSTYKPYELFPNCSKPFMLLLSDIYPSYDSDQIPGSSFTKTDGSTFTEDVATPQLGLGVQTSGKSLLNTLTDTIGTSEAIASNSWYIGESSSVYDNLCTSKAVTSLSLLRGLCPNEPTKRGTYYAAALAYYGRTEFKSKVSLTQDVNTYAVALSSPFSDMKVRVGGNYVTFLPLGKSVSGSYNIKTACHDRCTVTSDTDGLHLTNCAANSFCPTNQIVNFFVDDIRYNSSNDVIYARYRINYEDVEQGADHDMDAIVQYEICTQEAATAHYGSCTTTLAASEMEIKLSSDYAAGSIDQVLGFIISGTTSDGPYLVVRDRDVPLGGDGGDTPAIVGNVPLTWSKVFTTTGAPTGVLKNPLWYAAKWGAFKDGNNNNKPDLAGEWDNDGNGVPDNYYLVVNPLKLEQQLDKALTDILKTTSSGTAASILNNSEGTGANLLQAVFYPLKNFDDSTEVSWIGELQNLWYSIDPFMNNTSIREDTTRDNILNLKQDYITKFYFDSSQSKTLVQRFTDSNGDGMADSATPLDTISPDDVKSLWKAGKKLWERNVATDARTIYTHTGNSSLDDGTTGFAEFSSTSSLKDDATFRTYLQVASNTEAAKLINFVHGVDQSGYRPRKVTISGCGLTDASACTREWKLGDIVSSTPRLVSNVKLNTYDLAPTTGYNDSSYKAYSQTSTYLHRGMALVGGNDGMLHAFNLGVLKERSERYSKAEMDNNSGALAVAADNLGKEMWSFIPKAALPYLRYLTCVNGGGDTTYCGDTDYNHLFMVDRTPTISDASILIPAVTTTCTAPTDYSTCDKLTDGSTWTTIAIGGMGFGGSSRLSTDACTTGSAGTCTKTPIAGTGLSSYFALDVKDPANPKYMWDFNGDPANNHFLGATTTGPAIVRVNSTGGIDNKNGKWFAVFASGSTGPIDTTKHQFLGTSSQNLKLFVVDLKSGALLRTIDTGVSNAFAGTLSSAVVDTDRSQATSGGYYSDDAVYIGYTTKDTSVTPNTWTKGGVLRLVTKDNPDPAQWAVSTVMNNIGPVTTTVTKLQDRNNKTLWLYFGTGRYFYKSDDPSASVQQRLYGVKEPCYSTSNRQIHTPLTSIAGGTDNDIDPTCTDAISGTIVNQSGDASTAPAATLAATAPGWYVNLDIADSTSLSERAITDPVALPNGNVFFTTFKPSADICKFGGDSMIWATRYNTGAAPPATTMQGTALMQVSTGAFAEVKLATAFANLGNARLDGRRLATPIQGVPPTAQGLSLITNPKPIKKFLHVREK